MEIPGEKLLIKLWESLADKGIGGLLQPWQIRRTGRAAIEVKRLEMLELAQAEHDVASIRAGQRTLLADGRLADVSAPLLAGLEEKQVTAGAQVLQPAAETALRLSVADAMRREINVTRAVLAAEADLQSDAASPPDNEPTEDWLFRWRDHAATTSADELTSLWGKVLAGEVRAPGRFSLRTLDFLKNLSQREALAIERVAAFIVQSAIPWTPQNAVAQGPREDDLLEMHDLGLLSGAPGLALSITWPTEIDTGNGYQRLLRAKGRALLVSHADATKKLSLHGGVLTALGQQVFLLSNPVVDEQWLRTVGRDIVQKGFEVRICNVRKLDNDRTQPVDIESL